MSRFRLLLGVMAAGFVVPVPRVDAMPNFARKYDMTCNGCHTIIPRLNETGYQFRKAGFRNPNEIGEDAKTEFEHTFTARIQGRFDSRHREDPGPAGTVKTTSNHLTLHEVTLYPISSSFGKYYSSLTELSLLNEDFVEIENAYFRYAHGNDRAFFSGRIGIMHPFEGYGASDRPYSINRPLFQTVAASHNQSTYFTPWGFDQAGLELAYVLGRTTFSGTLFNGLVLLDDDGAFKSFPAAGGELQKPDRFHSTNSKDVQALVNHILKEDGSGISGFFYHGYLDLPKDPTMDPADFDLATSFQNKFDRAAVYAAWTLMPKLVAQGAYQWGQDHLYDPVSDTAEGKFTSEGFFGELDAPISDYLTLGGRYDYFDPSRDRTRNIRRGLTAFANVPMNDGFQWIAEFRHLEQERVAAENVKDDNFQLRLIWIW